MKALKISCITLVAIVSVMYLAFLFAVPRFVKLSDFTYELKSETNPNQGLVIKLEDIKVSTAWNLSAGASVGKLNGYMKDGKKFAQVDNLNATVSLPYLLIKRIKIDKISADKAIARLEVDKNGKFIIEKFIPSDSNEQEAQNPLDTLPYGFQLSENMPSISAKKYSLTCIDAVSAKHYSLKGEDLKVSDFYLNKKIKVKTNGKIVLDEKEQFNYKISLLSHVMPDFAAQPAQETSNAQVNILEILKNISALNLTANLDSDIKIDGELKDPKIFGVINLDNLSANIKGTQLPASSLKLSMEGNNVKILSELYSGINEKASINGNFEFGKKQFLDLNVKSNKLELKNLFSIANTVLPVFGFKNLSGINADGAINANFNIKTNFKTINSDGFLDVKNANVYYNAFNIALRNINADIDFSSNQINIKQASASFNGAPVSLKGAINSNAYANITVLADKIPLKAAILALGQVQLLNENNINSGIITLNGIIKGNLNNIVPQINVNASNINIYNKPNKAQVLLSSAIIDAKTTGVKTNGIGQISGLKLVMAGLPTFAVPNSKISFDEKDVNFDDVYALVNNSKITILGKITDYASKMNVNITANGMLDANDIKTSLDKEIQKTVRAKGRLPMAVKISGNDKVININGQILANNLNHLSIVDISSLAGRTSLINAKIKVENNALKLEDVSINALSTNKGLSSNFENNLLDSTKVLVAKGLISNLSGKVQQINGLNISIPHQTTISIPGYPNSKVQLKGDLNIAGSSTNPTITGMLSVPALAIPTLNISGQNISVNATKNLIDIYCSRLNVVDSVMNIVLTMNNSFNKGIYIKSMEFNASNINVDSMMKMLDSLPQNAAAPGTNASITIANGKGKIERLRSGNIVITNITSDFNLSNNLFKLNNIEAMAYSGKIAGNVTYNLLYASSQINIQGRGLVAQSAMYACTGMKNLMQGTLDFDAINLIARGITETQIMQSLKGKILFQITNGQMGTLGKLENLLYAQNILANNILKTTAGAIAGAVKVKKTGDFKYIKGMAILNNGWAELEKIQTSGPAMSMYVTGRYNLLNNFVSLTALGRLSNEVVDVLGPIGNFSVNSLLSSIPKIGEVTSSLINQMTTNPNSENLSLLPELSPQQPNTKEFKAVINGPVDSTSSVKSFKWLATPKIGTETPTQSSSTTPSAAQQVLQNAKTNAQNAINKVLNNQESAQTTIPQNTQVPTTPANNGVADFINNLPNLKN